MEFHYLHDECQTYLHEGHHLPTRGSAPQSPPGSPSAARWGHWGPPHHGCAALRGRCYGSGIWGVFRAPPAPCGALALWPHVALAFRAFAFAFGPFAGFVLTLLILLPVPPTPITLKGGGDPRLRGLPPAGPAPHHAVLRGLATHPRGLSLAMARVLAPPWGRLPRGLRPRPVALRANQKCRPPKIAPASV